jgi:hypothetical protein
MRLTVNLDSELYALAKSLAKAEDCTISAAINRLLTRAFLQERQPDHRTRRPAKRNGFVVSRGTRAITDEMVRQAEAEDDEQ